MFRFRNLYFLIFVITLGSCQPKSNDKFTDTYYSGSIKIGVDNNFKPIVDEQLAVFNSQYPKAHVTPVYTDELSAVSLLIKDSLRVAIATRPLVAKELDYLKQHKFAPRSYKLAIDGIALILNKHNPDTLINLTDLRKILTGKVKNWNDIYPRSSLGRIRVVFDNPNSSTVRYAIDSICIGDKLSEELNAQHSNEEVINYVSKTPNAIGVIGVNWLNNNSNDSTNLTFNSSIRVMSVSNQEVANESNSFKPYQYYLFSGEYPLTRTIYVILNDPRGSLPSTVSNFLTSDKGQRIFLKAGLVPATQPIRLVQVKDENVN